MLLLIILSVIGLIKGQDVKFLWGTATAAYQIEGGVNQDGRGESIWDVFSHIPGKTKNGDTGDIADDSYNRMYEDIRLMKNLGILAHRFSISWTRILPTGSGKINYLGINFYNKFIDELIRNGIEPMVTIYHWDLPQALEDEYSGWLDKKIVTDFTNYADICFSYFGDRVKYWITINEPWTFCYLGYVTGLFAPGRCSDRKKCKKGDSSTEGYIAAHNVLNAHAAAVELYRLKYQNIQGGKIAITLNHDWSEPLTQSVADIDAAERKNIFSMGWFGDPIAFGHYPQLMVDVLGSRLPTFTKEESERLKGSFDYWALNHYSTKYISKGSYKIYPGNIFIFSFIMHV
jgi:beta-glucosidase/6-phospho-beta-glucosidase/beta-galactosidase